MVERERLLPNCERNEVAGMYIMMRREIDAVRTEQKKRTQNHDVSKLTTTKKETKVGEEQEKEQKEANPRNKKEMKTNENENENVNENDNHHRSSSG